MAPELEEARALGELLRRRAGARSGRIVYIAWDGEEPGLLGSTEWVEHHDDELRQQAVVYINTDGNGRGFLSAGGSHSLEHFINGSPATSRIPRPAERLEAAGRRRSSRPAPPRSGRRARPRRSPDRRARLGLGLLAVSPAPRHADAESRLRRPRRRRHLSLDLRRHLPLHEVPRHRLPLRPCARADGRHRGHPPRRCRPAAVRVHEPRRRGADLS